MFFEPICIYGDTKPSLDEHGKEDGYTVYTRVTLSFDARKACIVVKEKDLIGYYNENFTAKEPYFNTVRKGKVKIHRISLLSEIYEDGVEYHCIDPL